MITISGYGVDLWDISDATSPALLSSVIIEGIDYGDNTNAVWGMFFHGDVLYVGGTNTGLHVVDARNQLPPYGADGTTPGPRKPPGVARRSQQARHIRGAGRAKRRHVGGDGRVQEDRC